MSENIVVSFSVIPATASFIAIMGQMTEMSQRKKRHKVLL